MKLIFNRFVLIDLYIWTLCFRDISIKIKYTVNVIQRKWVCDNFVTMRRPPYNHIQVDSIDKSNKIMAHLHRTKVDEKLNGRETEIYHIINLHAGFFFFCLSLSLSLVSTGSTSLSDYKYNFLIVCALCIGRSITLFVWRLKSFSLEVLHRVLWSRNMVNMSA